MATITDLPGTVLGPLVTPWAAPSSCNAHILLCSFCDEGFRGQTCVTGKDGKATAQDHTGCWPPVTERGTGVPPFIGWGFYSPGTECPTGYVAACTARYGLRPEWDIEFNLQQDETALGCCPSGFQCTNRNGNTCIQIAATRTNGSTVVVKTGFCSGTEVVDIQLATFPDIITSLATWKEDGSITTETYTATRKITLLAPMFQVNYRSSDMLPIETSESSLSGSSTSSIPNASETGQDEPRESDSGLPGDKIGIIAGAAIGGFLVCAVTAWFFWRRRKRGQARISPATEDHPPPVEIHELKSHSNTTPSTLPTEMGSNPHPVELPGSVPSGARQPYS